MIAFKDGGPKNPNQPGTSARLQPNPQPDSRFGSLLELDLKPAARSANPKDGAPAIQAKKTEDTKKLHALLESWLDLVQLPSAESPNREEIMNKIRACREADFSSPSAPVPKNTPLILACAIRDPELVDFVLGKLKESAGSNKPQLLKCLTYGNMEKFTALHATVGSESTAESVRQTVNNIIHGCMKKACATLDDLKAAHSFWRAYSAPKKERRRTPAKIEGEADAELSIFHRWFAHYTGHSTYSELQEAKFAKEMATFVAIQAAGISDSEISAFLQENRSNSYIILDHLVSAMLHAGAENVHFLPRDRAWKTPWDCAYLNCDPNVRKLLELVSQPADHV